MVIVFVEDNYQHKTDGTAVSTHRFREELIKHGHTVRVIAIGVEGQDMYGLKELFVPIVSNVAKKQNMHFAKFDKKVVTEAFTGADIVHLIFPWSLERKCLKLAHKMGIPVCGAFHCQPENITYNMKIKLLGIVNTFIYFLFKIWLYRKIENIHCPSNFAAAELKRHKYDARLHIISNGILDTFKPARGTIKKPDDRINVLMIGRLAEEKRQDLIIKAVKHSKYRDKIYISFVGRGPMYKRYLRQAAGLPNPPRFERQFIPQKQLLEMIYQTDVYIHASEVELESISCLEAISCAKVPIISDSKKSAASQFALDERSLFKKGNYLDLRDKLDYWIEHPEERERMGGEYAKLGEFYDINHSIVKLEQMFKDTITDFKTKKMIKEERKIKKYDNRLRRNKTVKKFFCLLFYYIIAIPILAVVNRCYFGLKIENKGALKKIKKTGVITICNHVHYMDSAICAIGLFPRKPIFISLPSNFSLDMTGFFVDVLGAVPIPTTRKEIQTFIYALSKNLRKGRLVHFYPEGELIKYNTELRQFKRGAFYLAVDARIPILPMKFVCRPARGLFKLLKKKTPCLTLVFGDPIYPNYYMHKNEAISDIQKRAENIMQTLAV
ncbi:MAG: glycosyltransferase [Spirochaetaceae bacterium]|nr:glycosyltransferase [Spirochaetaceae bacterium]